MMARILKLCSLVPLATARWCCTLLIFRSFNINFSRWTFKYKQPNQALRAEILRECSPLPTCHMSHVRCHVSHVTWHHYSQTVRARDLKLLTNLHNHLVVTCHMSCVVCHVSCFRCHMSQIKNKLTKIIGGATCWMVCYQRGIPRLVLIIERCVNC